MEGCGYGPRHIYGGLEERVVSTHNQMLVSIRYECWLVTISLEMLGV